ncbi:MAG: hypothetical protein WCS70_00610 [Verrucomicrobiota bacterium]
MKRQNPINPFDLLALVLAGAMIECRSRPAWAVLIAVSALAVGLGTFSFATAITQFGGLSGIACAAIGYIALLCIRQSGAGRYVMLGALLLLAGKILWECATHRALFVASDSRLVVFPLAHAIGLASAFGLWLGTSTFQQRRRIHQTERRDRSVATTVTVIP